MMLPARSSNAAATVLVVDDDRRVVELLRIALTAHGYRVISAEDGDEGLRTAIRERPDLVVLDVRLPRKSGLEVCELLRQDPEDPFVPIVMVSAAAETEARLQGLARGADDYLAKPFSPKELIARIKRLLVRAGEGREARRRGREAELELAHAREEARRSQLELRREQQVRELMASLGRELHHVLDPDRLARRFLMAVQRRFGVPVAAFLATDGRREAFEPVAIHGDGFERVAGLELATGGELVRLIAGLGRPMRRQELERLPDLGAELTGLVAAGFSFLAPLRGESGLIGLLVTDEPVDGRDLGQQDLALLGAMCETAALALGNAHRARAQAEAVLGAMSALAMAGSAGERAAREEAVQLAACAACVTLLPARERSLIARAIDLCGWADAAPARRALEIAAAGDPSGMIPELVRLLDAASHPEPLVGSADEVARDESQAAAILGVACRYASLRVRRHSPERALTAAMAEAGEALDETLRQVLAGAVRERKALERSAV